MKEKLTGKRVRQIEIKKKKCVRHDDVKVQGGSGGTPCPMGRERIARQEKTPTSYEIGERYGSKWGRASQRTWETLGRKDGGPEERGCGR